MLFFPDVPQTGRTYPRENCLPREVSLPPSTYCSAAPEIALNRSIRRFSVNLTAPTFFFPASGGTEVYQLGDDPHT